MSLLDFLIRRTPPYKDDNDELARPVPDETTNLESHVDICARRFKALRRDTTELQRTSEAQNILLWALVILLFINGSLSIGGIKDVIELFLK